MDQPVEKTNPSSKASVLTRVAVRTHAMLLAPGPLQPEMPTVKDASGDRHGGSSLPWLFEQVRDFSLLEKVMGTNSSCTPCSSYDSTILLRNQKPRAGLHDRFIIMYHAQALANSLCARLAIGPTSRLLSRRHNQNVLVNSSWWWGRFTSRCW